jgi:hypothetical protein
MLFFALLLKKGIFCLVQAINRIGVFIPIVVLCQKNKNNHKKYDSFFIKNTIYGIDSGQVLLYFVLK